MLPSLRVAHSDDIRLTPARAVLPMPGRTPASEHRLRARYANMTLGLWLFVSAFVWPQTTASRLNTCIVGALVVVSATMATGIGLLRQLTSILALWLLSTTVLVYPANDITFWNNILVASAVLVFSLIPNHGALQQSS